MIVHLRRKILEPNKLKLTAKAGENLPKPQEKKLRLQ